MLTKKQGACCHQHRPGCRGVARGFGGPGSRVGALPAGLTSVQEGAQPLPPQGAQHLECCVWSLLQVAKQMSPDSLPPNGTRPPYRRVANAADSTGAQSSALEELFLSSIQGPSGLTSHPPSGVRPQKWCVSRMKQTLTQTRALPCEIASPAWVGSGYGHAEVGCGKGQCVSPRLPLLLGVRKGALSKAGTCGRSDCTGSPWRAGHRHTTVWGSNLQHYKGGAPSLLCSKTDSALLCAPGLP